jgi:polar amino acid transport system substrate-binding protein
MQAKLKTAAIAALALFMGTAAAHADLKFGVAAEPYAPFSSQDASGKWVGWEVDLMEAVCAEMKEKCEMVGVAWDGIIPALTSKKFDVIWSSMSITEERMKTIDFTDMYYNTPSSIIGPKGGAKDIAPASLKGKTLGVQVSTTHERYAQKFFAGAGVTVKTYQTQDEANQDLAAGRVDVVQADSSALDAFLKTDAGKACCEAYGNVPDDAETLGLGVGGGLRKDDAELKARLNEAIKKVAASGGFDKITTNYPDLQGVIVTPKP